MNDSHIVDHLPGEIDVYPMSSIELFERAFCTNFSCCNILFPDLHALLDHYDATAHSHDCFPAPLSFSYSPASSPPSSPSTHNSTPTASPPHRRSVSLACPNADAPPSPILLNSHLNMSLSLSLNPTLAQYPIVPGLVPMVHPSIYHPDASALADYPTYEHCYDTATRYLASARGSDAESSAPLNSQSPGPGPGIGIGSIGKGKGGAGKTRRRRSSLSSSPRSLSQSSSSSDASVPSPTKKKKKGKADPAGASLPGTRRRRRSQKAYQCPVPGCTKSYLNPNGLKYHQEKGKCKIELPVEHSSPVSVADAASSTDMGIKPGTAPVPVPVPSGPPTVDHHEQQQQVRIHHPQPRHAVLQWSPSTVEKHRSSELDSESELESGLELELVRDS